MTARVKSVDRGPQTFWERIYVPAVLKGLSITFRRLFVRTVTMQYPEQTWTVRDDYRGAPALVKDHEGRPKCVACSLCEFVCPSKAIHIEPGELEPGNPIERGPRVFEINMLRCIFCGLCEEACPEDAIHMTREFVFWGRTREDLVFDKETLYRMGGVRHDRIRKWARE